MKKLSVLLFLVILFSCEENEQIIENLFIGNWSHAIYNAETTTFTRVKSLQNEDYGISFKENGNFIEHTSGWCGTPPLTFFNIEGTYQLENTLIRISTQSYPTTYAWRILSLTATELVVKRELSEQELEHKNLMALFDEIQNLSYSVSCLNANGWLFTAYGSKACGGSQGYIAYSSEIDTVIFLQKTASYTQLEKNFNIKWGVLSDCSLPNTPISVACQNGFPIFIY
jgi:hypothetical protein